MARARVLIAALTGASLLGGAPAGAATGVSIDVARIAVFEELAPGGVYLLPAFGIRNPGTKRTTYHLGVTYIESQSRKQPPVAWFRFEPSTVTLDGGEARAIGAGVGDYAALVGAEIAAERGGTRVGARAAARLTFVVHRVECAPRVVAAAAAVHVGERSMDVAPAWAAAGVAPHVATAPALLLQRCT